jgi:hypothetical protein
MGVDVGCTVGLAVGFLVFVWDVGFEEGCRLGLVVGFALGCIVGRTVVGESMTVGDSVGKFEISRARTPDLIPE